MMGLPIHPNNLLNDGRTFSDDFYVRQLIPDFTATLLRDIYDYTITLPSTINTFYANLNRSTNDLIVRGNPGDADDIISVNEIGNDVRILVNSTSERIDSSAVDLITIFGQEGEDAINVDQTPVGIPTSVNGGLGDDVMTIANATGNLSFVDGDVSINGGGGNDILNIQDLGHASGQTYQITPFTITPNGLGYSINYSNLGTIFLQGDQGDSLFHIDGVGFHTAMPATGVDFLVVNAGSGANSLRVKSGVVNLNTSVGTLLGQRLDLTVTGASTRVNFLESQDLASLSLLSGRVSLEPNAAHTVLRTRVLDLSGMGMPTGTLDLHDNGVIVDYPDASASPYDRLRSQIVDARNQNAPNLWTGSGITSSVAALDSLHAAIGYAEAHRLFNGNAGTFLGQTLAAGNRAVLIRATQNGDANLDGFTDGSDFGHWNASKFAVAD